MRLLIAGCSFSASDNDITTACSNPITWPHYLVKNLTVDQFANLSIPGSGNISIVNNLIYFLETKLDWNPTNTLIGFNITELYRTDLICPSDHPDRNKNFSWSHDLGHSWLTHGFFGNPEYAPLKEEMHKHMGYEQVLKTNCLELTKLFTYLEYRKFSYFYTLIDNSVLTDSPDWFRQTLDTYRHRQALLDGMSEFVVKNNAVSDDNWHPSKFGHELIGTEIVSFINHNELTKNLS